MSPAILNRGNFGAGDIAAFGSYMPYGVHKMIGGDGSNWDGYSSTILALKNGKPHAIPFFVDHIEKHLGQNIVIVTVPSHDPENTTSGLRALAAALAAKGGRVDGSGCLVRTKKIDKLANGGDRKIDVHEGSIAVANVEVFKGKDVLLLDDVTKTGNSLRACKQKLLDAGAKSVECAAIGKV